MVAWRSVLLRKKIEVWAEINALIVLVRVKTINQTFSLACHNIKLQAS